jgi:Leucine-rich repeat (LRR) protein
MPLVVVSCGGTQVSDLSPLKGMPLIDLGCDFKPELDTEWIRSIKTLVSINGKPVDEFWKEVEAGLGEKKATINTPNDPAFKKWVKQVATLSADKQVEAVARKLKELNPGFDGKVTSKIDFLVVTEVQFFADRVTDISPVRALPGLKTLNCSGTYDGEWNDKWKLADLSPLRGMSLTALLFSFSKVSDLSPLTGMPLTQLQFQWTQVTDLSPLNGMRLTTIVCGGTGVSDLSPLKGMPLSTIDFRGTKVSDLSPLKGMPLTMLFCNGTLVTDLTVLKDMPLNYLWLDFKPERDTEILRSIKTLETINDKPAAEFWKEVEEKKAEKKQ